MKYRNLGNAGIKVSTIALGAWINYGEGKVAPDIARKVVEQAYKNGINFFDLADSYGNGSAERQMGALLRQFQRHTLVISTKVFWPMSDDINDRGLSRKHILESIDKSLERLGLDYVDLYFCHRPDPETPIRETAQAMNTLIEQGKSLYWGTSEWEPDQIIQAYEICNHYGWHLPQVEQPQYSMLVRERVENQVLPVTHARGIGLVTWSPLAMGMLTGKYDNGIPEDSRFNHELWAKERYMNEQSIEQVRLLKPIADQLGISRSQLALAWNLRHPGVSSVIIGATRPEQVDENCHAADITLDDDVIQQIETILSTKIPA